MQWRLLYHYSHSSAIKMKCTAKISTVNKLYDYGHSGIIQMKYTL